MYNKHLAIAEKLALAFLGEKPKTPCKSLEDLGKIPWAHTSPGVVRFRGPLDRIRLKCSDTALSVKLYSNEWRDGEVPYLRLVFHGDGEIRLKISTAGRWFVDQGRSWMFMKRLAGPIEFITSATGILPSRLLADHRALLRSLAHFIEGEG